MISPASAVPAAAGSPAASLPAAPAVAAASVAPPAVLETPPAVTAGAIPRCENCGAGVTGRYCGTCGQRLEPPLHSLGHFLQVAAEDVTHADSRLWRTLWALLFKPGFLTREFLDGRRASYLPPVRLYLVLSVVFFVWLAATGHAPGETHVTPETRAGIDEARQAVAEARAAGAPVVLIGVPRASGAAPTADAAASAAKPASAAPRTTYSALEGDPQQCKEIHYDGRWKSTIEPLLYRGCVQATRDNGRSLTQSFLHNVPRAMFVFLPLLAAVMMLLYWHPRHYYVEHLLFCVHNHAFAFLVLLFAGILALLPVPGPLIGWATALYVGWYLYRAMRVMYGQGRGRTVAKLGVLSFVYLVAGSLMLGATALFAFVTL